MDFTFQDFTSLQAGFALYKRKGQAEATFYFPGRSNRHMCSTTASAIRAKPT